MMNTFVRPPTTEENEVRLQNNSQEQHHGKNDAHVIFVTSPDTHLDKASNITGTPANAIKTKSSVVPIGSSQTSQVRSVSEAVREFVCESCKLCDEYEASMQAGVCKNCGCGLIHHLKADDEYADEDEGEEWQEESDEEDVIEQNDEDNDNVEDMQEDET